MRQNKTMRGRDEDPILQPRPAPLQSLVTSVLQNPLGVGQVVGLPFETQYKLTQPTHHQIS